MLKTEIAKIEILLRKLLEMLEVLFTTQELAGERESIEAMRFSLSISYRLSNGTDFSRVMQVLPQQHPWVRAYAETVVR